ncbi:MAG: DMT family transporter [Christensenellaceae bacterium]|nr:DMT family transporter [Christensenellaceae bacterium]
MKKLRSSLLLLIASIIWGITFIAQSDAMEHIGPFTFNFARSFIGSVVLLPVIRLFGRAEAGAANDIDKKKARKALLVGGILCGIALFAATGLQQFGISLGSSVGKAGFITSFYIILVPIFGLLLKKRTSAIIWISMLIAVVGLYLLCITEGFSIETSDLLYLGCAVFFAIHILIISVYSPLVNGVALSCMQFAVSAVLNGICMLLLEKPSFSDIFAAYIPLLYAGVLACGIAYTLQIIGQKDLDPTIASVIMCLESVVSVIAGWLILHQQLSGRETAGCVIMLLATILAQLPIGAGGKGKASEQL